MDLFDDLDRHELQRLRDLATTLAERSGDAPGRAVLAIVEAALSEAALSAEEIDSPAFEVRLFGHPRVTRRQRDGATREVEWRLRRSLRALVYLALAPGRRATKDELVEALWPGAGADTVAKNFHPTLSDLRRSLAAGATDDDLPTVVYRAGVYVLEGTADELAGGEDDKWRIDVERFEARLEQADEARRGQRDAEELAHLQAAWKLYRGPLASEIEAPWIERRRAELHRAWLATLDRIGRLASDAGRDVLALDAWRRLLIEEPFEERVHLGVMELYGRRGRRDLVRRQYVKLQEHLAELEVEPARETQRRYLELMG